MTQPLEEKVLKSFDGTEIYYLTGGSKDPKAHTLLLIHGLGSNATRWTKLAQLPFCQEQCRLIILHLRGHGHSSTRRNVGIDSFAKDCLAVLDQEKCEKAILIGHCLGANIAGRCWELNKTHIAGIVLIEPFFAKSLRRDWKFFNFFLTPILLLVAGTAKLLNAIGIRRRNFPMIDYYTYDEWVRTRLHTSIDVIRWMGPWADLHTMPVTSYIASYRTLYTYAPDWKKVTAPMLVIFAKGEQMFSGERDGHLFGDNPKVMVRTIEGSHFMLTDNVQEVAQAIQEFVKTI
ncbi:MAG TPA: alpha/beta hydrolase [Nitrospiria bacterium]|jgi:esterase|nr:alpha/beta hydrolase [Nitrospiria bacterium]